MKVLIPDLPSADELLPYLRRIDAAKWYTNDGPLVRELEEKTSGVAVSSGTLGLELAAKAVFPLHSPYGGFLTNRIRIPAFTFPATATALLRAGFTPILCDVDRDSWALPNPDDRSLVVSPFGAPVSGYLVDAASSWGNPVDGNRVYSLHATKCFPAGEGGLICGDEGLLDRVRRARNFGLEYYLGIVNCSGGTNAKLSEYHAAVALASLERLPRVVAKRQALEARYRANLAGVVEMQNRPVGSYAIFPVLVPDRERVALELKERGIETRSWYCPTLEKHPVYANLHTDGPLKVAKMLSEQVLCLPYHSFMTEGDADQVSDCLRAALHQRRPLRATA